MQPVLVLSQALQVTTRYFTASRSCSWDITLTESHHSCHRELYTLQNGRCFQLPQGRAPPPGTHGCCRPQGGGWRGTGWTSLLGLLPESQQLQLLQFINLFPFLNTFFLFILPIKLLLIIIQHYNESYRYKKHSKDLLPFIKKLIVNKFPKICQMKITTWTIQTHIFSQNVVKSNNSQ